MKHQEQDSKPKEQITVTVHSASDASLENIIKEFLLKKVRHLAANQARVIK